MPYLRRRRSNRKRRRTRRNTSFGRKRPVLIHSRSGWRRPARSKMARGKKSVRVNRRRRKRRVARRNYPMVIRHANPVRRRRRVARRNPVRRYRRRRTRRNPNFIKQITSQRVLMQGLTIGGGMIGGAFLIPAVERMIPADNRATFSKYLGAVNLIVGALMYGSLRNRQMKELGLVIAGTGVYDLVQQNIPQLPLPTLRATALVSQVMAPMSASYGIARRPVSPVARQLASNYRVPARAGYGASYMAPGMRTQGFAGDTSMADMGFDGYDA